MQTGWLEGKVALIVGGGSGVGLGVVDTFAEEGAKTAVLDRSIDALGQDERQATLAVAGDVRSQADCRRAVTEVIESFGRLDALVVCAGITDHFTALADLSDDAIDAAFAEVFDINVKGAMLVTKAALPELTKSEGNIVYTLSNAAFRPGGGGPLYTASKFAVRGLVAQLSYELAPRIRVNGVAPGGTVTALRGPDALGMQGQRLMDVPDIGDMIRAVNPLQVVPEPRDHAWAYVYLASKERTKAVTGCVIRTDGGLDSRGLVPLTDAVGADDM